MTNIKKSSRERPRGKVFIIFFIVIGENRYNQQLTCYTHKINENLLQNIQSPSIAICYTIFLIIISLVLINSVEINFLFLFLQIASIQFTIFFFSIKGEEKFLLVIFWPSIISCSYHCMNFFIELLRECEEK